MTKDTQIQPNSSHQSSRGIIITGNPNPKGEVSFGKTPCILICPYCRHLVTTKLEPKATEKTHLFALLLCVFSCWIFCCCCYPYCMKTCQGRNHYCPKCNALLGLYTN